MRQNIGPEIYIDGKVIPTGTLVVYPFANVHLDPTIYPDPWKFDPERPQPTGHLAYLGWGGGAFFLLRLSPKTRGVGLELNLTFFYVTFFFFGIATWDRESDVPRFATGETTDQAPRRAATHGFRLRDRGRERSHRESTTKTKLERRLDRQAGSRPVFPQVQKTGCFRASGSLAVKGWCAVVGFHSVLSVPSGPRLQVSISLLYTVKCYANLLKEGH